MDRNQIVAIIKSHSKVLFIDVKEEELENLADHILAVVTAYYEVLEKEITISRIDRKARGAH